MDFRSVKPGKSSVWAYYPLKTINAHCKPQSKINQNEETCQVFVKKFFDSKTFFLNHLRWKSNSLLPESFYCLEVILWKTYIGTRAVDTSPDILLGFVTRVRKRAWIAYARLPRHEASLRPFCRNAASTEPAHSFCYAPGVCTFSGLKARRITAQGKAFTPPPWVLEYEYSRPERARELCVAFRGNCKTPWERRRPRRQEL